MRSTPGMASKGRLRLKVNADKSEVARPGQVHLLGFSLRKRVEAEGVEVSLSGRTRERLDTKLRALTPRNWGAPLEACMEQVSTYVRGWVGYFRLCTEEGATLFQRYDAHIRRRMRAIVIKQKKRARHLARHLTARGVSARSARDAAWCSKSPWKQSLRFGLQNAYPNAWFHDRMASLWTTWRRFNPPSVAREVSTGQLRLPGL